MNTHKTIIPNGLKGEITQLSISWQMDKPHAICPGNEIIFSNKKERVSALCYNVGEPKYIMWGHR